MSRINSRFCGVLFICILTCAGTAYARAGAATRNEQDADEAARKERQTRLDIASQRQREESARSGRRHPFRGRARLSAKERKRLKEMLAPRNEDLAKYQGFLSNDKTGIFRLLPDFDCVSKMIVKISGDCVDFVDGGSTKAFREGAETFDIRFRFGRIEADGFFVQHIFVGLGDVPIESVSMATPGMSFIEAFVPNATYVGANEQSRELAAGIDSDAFHYSRIVEPIPGQAYALRIVAYKNGNSLVKRRQRVFGPRSPDPSLWFSFWRLQRDNRVDVTVAFRVIRREDDGGITVLWKQLNRKKSPTITFNSEEELADLEH